MRIILATMCFFILMVSLVFVLLIVYFCCVVGKENDEAVKLIIEAIKRDTTPDFTPLRKAACISNARKILFTCKYKFSDITQKDIERTTRLIVALTLFLEENPEFYRAFKRDADKKW